MNQLSSMIIEASQVRKEVEVNSKYQVRMEKNINRLNERINRAKDEGKSYTGFIYDEEVEREIRQLYSEKGYHFKPTGIKNGVWQRTEDICW